MRRWILASRTRCSIGGVLGQVGDPAAGRVVVRGERIREEVSGPVAESEQDSESVERMRTGTLQVVQNTLNVIRQLATASASWPQSDGWTLQEGRRPRNQAATCGIDARRDGECSTVPTSVSVTSAPFSPSCRSQWSELR